MSTTVPSRSTVTSVFYEAAPQEGLSRHWQLLVFLLVVGALVSRRPDMFLDAHFYAEDGRYWYAQAYNQGWINALRIPEGGYLNTLPRLVAALTLLCPFHDAPWIMNLGGLLLQVLPVTMLLSARCLTWGPLGLRMTMAAIYLVMPHTAELHVVLTNAQWHLALLMILLAFAETPRTWYGRAPDLLLFLLGSVSGPFGILMTPLMVFYWWRRRERWTLLLAAVVAAGALLQLYLIFHGDRQDSPAGATQGLGATPQLLIRILGGNIFLGGMTGLRDLLIRLPLVLIAVFACFGLTIVLCGLRYGTLALRLMILFSWALLTLALWSPIIPGDQPAWQLLTVDFIARYWYYPMLSFFWSAAACVFLDCPLPVKAGAYCVLAPLLFGAAKDWKYPPMNDYDFPRYAQQFEQLPRGAHLMIPLFPQPWTMELVKH